MHTNHRFSLDKCLARIRLGLLFLVVLGTGSGYAAIRTVDADGGSGYTTVLAAFQAGGLTDTVQIQGTDIDTYTESWASVSMGKSVLIRGASADPDSFPVISINSWGSFWVNGSGDVKFERVVLKSCATLSLLNTGITLGLKSVVVRNFTVPIFSLSGEHPNYLTVENSIFLGNSGAIFVAPPTTNMSGPYGSVWNSTFYGNTTVSSQNPDATQLSANKIIAIHNSIFQNNTTISANQAIKNAWTYNLIPSTESLGFWGTGSAQNDNAKFANLSTSFAFASDFKLQASSPARDIGPSYGAPFYDMAGVMRPVSTPTDMGAFKYVIPPDVISPVFINLWPMNNATGVPTTGNLTITFSEPVIPVNGNITLKRTSDNTIVETIDVTSAQVTGSGTNTIVIVPNTTLASATGYYLLIDGTAFDDLAGNSFPGISMPTGWNFTSVAPGTGYSDHHTTTITGWTPYGTRTWSQSGTVVNTDLQMNDGFLINNFTPASNGTFEVRLDPLTYMDCNGIILRYGDMANFYYISFYEAMGAGMSRIRFHVNSLSVVSDSIATYNLPSSTFYMRFVVMGNTISIFDSTATLIGTFTDASNLNPTGKVGYAHFDNYNANGSFDWSAWTDMPADGTPPTISSLVPADNAIHVFNGRQPLRMQFDESVQKGTGSITLKKIDNSPVETINVTSNQVAIGDAALLNGFETSAEDWTWGTAAMTRDNNRYHSGSYSLNAVTSAPWEIAEARYAPYNQDWSAFDSVITWVYTTTPGASVTQFTRSGADVWVNGNNTSLTQNSWTRLVSATHSAATPSLITSYGLVFSGAGTFWIDDAGLKKTGSNFVTVIPSFGLAVGSSYYMNVDVGSIKDLAGNSFTGISTPTAWNFQTNNGPTDIFLSPGTAAENLSPGSNVGMLSAIDPDGAEPFSYSLVTGTGSADNTSFNIAGYYLMTTQSFDYETKSSYSIRVQVSDGFSGVFEKQLFVAITNENDNTPVITSNGGLAVASLNVAENQTAVTTVVASDLDGTPPTFALNGGDDASLFSIDNTTGALKFNIARDFELPVDADANNAYNVVVRATDGTNTDDQTIAVTITNVNEAPVIISANSVNVIENQVAVMTIFSTDPDFGATQSFNLTGGADKNKFSINSSTGVLSFLVAPSFSSPTDVGLNNVYDVIVQVSDGSLTASQPIAISVVPANQPPVFSGATASVNAAENQTTVTTVAATDADGDNLMYMLTGGADQSHFNLNSSNGDLTFYSGRDYESPTDMDSSNTYELIVTVMDGQGGSDVQAITVHVTNINDNTPNITSNGGNTFAPISMAENATLVTTVLATDADAGSTLTYSIMSGPDQAKFSINSATGVLSFVASPDFEAPTDNGADNVYDFYVQVSDGNFMDMQTISVTVTNMNEAPTLMGAITASVPENQTGVMPFSASDPDVGTTFIYSLVGGADVAKFTINSTTGALAFLAAQDFEAPTDSGANNTYNVIVQVSDGALTATKSIAVTVTNLNDNIPAFTTSPSLSVMEGFASVGTVMATDADGAALTYSIFGGVDASQFTLSPATGILNFVSLPVFATPTDVGADNVYNLTVRATDGINTTDQNFSVTVTAVNRAPTNVALGSSTINENLASGSIVGALLATDPDVGNTFTYSLVAGTGSADNSKFVISTNTLKSLAIFDFEMQPTFSIRVRATDQGGLSYENTFAVTVLNVNEYPLLNSPLVDQPVFDGAYMQYILPASSFQDPDLGDILSYIATAPNGAALPGWLTFNSVTRTFDGNPSNADIGTYPIRVTATDGAGLAKLDTFNIVVTNQNDAPQIMNQTSASIASTSIPENTTVVVDIDATDLDLGDVLTYGIAGGADQAKFSIDPTSGVLSFIVAPNFEQPLSQLGTNSYVVQVRADDGAGGFDLQTWTVSVQNVNEVPVIVSANSLTVPEGTTTAMTVQGLDPDASATLSYSLTGGTDQSAFTINSSTGVLSFVRAPNFASPQDADMDGIYFITVMVSDGLSQTPADIYISISAQAVTQALIAGANIRIPLTHESNAQMMFPSWMNVTQLSGFNLEEQFLTSADVALMLDTPMVALDGGLRIQPRANVSGISQFRIRACKSLTQCTNWDTASVTISAPPAFGNFALANSNTLRAPSDTSIVIPFSDPDNADIAQLQMQVHQTQLAIDNEPSTYQLEPFGAVGQSFTVSSNASLGKIEVYAKLPLPYIHIYVASADASGGFSPPMNIIGDFYAPVSANTLQWHSIAMGKDIALVANHTYSFFLVPEDSLKVEMGVDPNNSYAKGNLYVGTSPTTAPISNSAWDLKFRIHTRQSAPAWATLQSGTTLSKKLRLAPSATDVGQYSLMLSLTDGVNPVAVELPITVNATTTYSGLRAIPQGQAVFLSSTGLKVSSLPSTLKVTVRIQGTGLDTLMEMTSDPMVWVPAPVGTYTFDWRLYSTIDQKNLATGTGTFDVATPSLKPSPVAWSMVGFGNVPLDLNTTNSSTQIFRWTETPSSIALNGYLDKSNLVRTEQGLGYWYWSESTDTIAMEPFVAMPSALSVPVEKVDLGWNMIANPWNWSVNPSSATWSSGPGTPEFWEWVPALGDYQPATELKPFVSYWVNTPVSQTLSLNPQPFWNASTALPKKSLPRFASANDWSVQVKLASGSKSDGFNLLGIHSLAKAGTDTLDGAEPPQGFGDFVKLSLGSKYEPLSRDIQHAGDANRWTVNLRSSTDRNGFVTFEGMGNQKLVWIENGMAQEIQNGVPIAVALYKTGSVAYVEVLDPNRAIALQGPVQGFLATMAHGVCNLSFAVPLSLDGQDASVEWLSTNGASLGLKSLGTLAAGQQSFALAKNTIPPGIVWIRLRVGSQQLVKATMVLSR